MFKQKAVGMLVLTGAVALAGFTGLANGKPTTTTQVEVVNRTVVVGTATLHVTGQDATQFRTPAFDVSPYSVIRLVVMRTGCSVDNGGQAIVYVENIGQVDKFLFTDQTAQQVYDVPGEALSILIGQVYFGSVCDYTVTIYGRRN